MRSVMSLLNQSRKQIKKQPEYARMQLILVAFLTLIAGGVVLAAFCFTGGRQFLPDHNGAYLAYNNMVFERIEDMESISALGFTRPVAASDCGERLIIIDEPKVLKGSTLYRLKDSESTALAVLKTKNNSKTKKQEYRLYKFCYYYDAQNRTGKEILDVCGSGTKLISVEIHSFNAGREKIVNDEMTQISFESIFRNMTPIKKTETIMEQIEQPGTWDGLIILKYKNGLTYQLYLYNEYNIISGFRSVYDIPEELSVLFGFRTLYS